VAVLVFLCVKTLIHIKLPKVKNNREGINKMFSFPLIFAVALLTFAHGANDVANAIGPLAAIYDSIMNGGVSESVGIPIWIMGIGGLGIAV